MEFVTTPRRPGPAPHQPGAARKVATTAVGAAAAGMWIAAGALTPTGRRLARVGVLVLAGAVGSTRPRSEEPGLRPSPTVVDPAVATVDRRATLAATVVSVVVLEVVGVLVRRRVEHRLLKRLRRRGHTHPHAALGLYTAVVGFAVVTASDLVEPYVVARTRIEGREVLDLKETRARR